MLKRLLYQFVEVTLIISWVAAVMCLIMVGARMIPVFWHYLGTVLPQ